MTEKTTAELPNIFVILPTPQDVIDFPEPSREPEQEELSKAQWMERHHRPLIKLPQVTTSSDYADLAELVSSNKYKPFIFVTSTLGGRGLDFPLDRNGHVIVATAWRSTSVLFNLIGRGARATFDANKVASDVIEKRGSHRSPQTLAELVTLEGVMFNNRLNAF